jgi:hypothetical protein
MLNKLSYLPSLKRLLICGFSVRFRGGSPNFAHSHFCLAGFTVSALCRRGCALKPPVIHVDTGGVRLRAMVLAVTFLVLPIRAEAQLESLTVTLLPASADFTLTSNSSTNNAAAPITATTTWSLVATRTNVSLYAYFSSTSAALAHSASGNTTDIPSSRVEVSVNGGPNSAFSQTVPFGAPNAGRQIFSQGITLVNLSGNRSDVLALNINLSGYSLPADTYTGSLRLRAIASP